MAVTVGVYNHTTRLLMAGSVDWANLKVMLLNDTATFVATHTTIDQVSNTAAYEVSGNGWTVGGELLPVVTITTVTTNDAVVDADDVEPIATGGTIGPAWKAAIYDATSGLVLKWVDFGEAWQAGETTPFRIRMLAGLFNADYTPA